MPLTPALKPSPYTMPRVVFDVIATTVFAAVAPYLAIDGNRSLFLVTHQIALTAASVLPVTSVGFGVVFTLRELVVAYYSSASPAPAPTQDKKEKVQ